MKRIKNLIPLAILALLALFLHGLFNFWWLYFWLMLLAYGQG